MCIRDSWQGVGQAKAVIFFILVALIALVQNKITTSKEVKSERQKKKNNRSVQYVRLSMAGYFQ